MIQSVEILGGCGEEAEVALAFPPPVPRGSVMVAAVHLQKAMLQICQGALGTLLVTKILIQANGV